MKLLVNGAVIRSNAIKLSREDNNTILKVSYLENKVLKEYTFIIPYEIMFRVQLIDNLSLIKSENECKFVHNPSEKDESVYAILHSEENFPSDIFVPSNKKKKVEIIKRFDYHMNNSEYGEFLSTIYFVKLQVSKDNSISIYNGRQGSKTLNKHFELSYLENNLKIKRPWYNCKAIECTPLSQL